MLVKTEYCKMVSLCVYQELIIQNVKYCCWFLVEVGIRRIRIRSGRLKSSKCTESIYSTLTEQVSAACQCCFITVFLKIVKTLQQYNQYGTQA